MKVEATREHLNRQGRKVKRGETYNTSNVLGKYLIGLGVVKEWVPESPKVEKEEFITKPENLGDDINNMGWQDLRRKAIELEVFSPSMNKEQVIKAINEATK